jgi:FkbM family methyltransferase
VVGVGHDFTGDIRNRLLNLAMCSIFDIGAHIGMTALEFGDEWPNASVYAFEPHPGNFSRMRSNLIGKPDMELFQMGFSDKPCEAPFHFDAEHPSMARVVSGGEAITDSIKLDTVDRFCSERGIQDIDLMKIDVEGHEMPVLRGASAMLSQGRIAVLRIESAIDPDSDYHTQLWDLCDFLHPNGYRVFGFYDQWEDTIDPSPRLRRFDVAFISPAVQERS